MLDYFPGIGVRATVCALTGDNQCNCATATKNLHEGNVTKNK